MYKFKNALIAFTGLLSLIALIALLTPATTYSQQTREVVVVNTAANPVPTTAQGTTTIAGTVQAQQSGSWDVSIAGPTVPFQEEVAFTFSAGSNGTFAAVGVPAGKRLVVEHVSGLVALPNGQEVAWTRINTLAVGGGVASNHYLEATAQASVPGIADYFVISQPMRVYAVGAIQIAAFRSDTAGSGQVNVTISGYLVDAV